MSAVSILKGSKNVGHPLKSVNFKKVATAGFITLRVQCAGQFLLNLWMAVTIICVKTHCLEPCPLLLWQCGAMVVVVMVLVVKT